MISFITTCQRQADLEEVALPEDRILKPEREIQKLMAGFGTIGTRAVGWFF